MTKKRLFIKKSTDILDFSGGGGDNIIIDTFYYIF